MNSDILEKYKINPIRIKSYKVVVDNYLSNSNISFVEEDLQFLYILVDLAINYSKIVPDYLRTEEVDQILSRYFDSIKNGSKKRSEVKRKVFNYYTGKLEYELEDGNHIEILSEPVIYRHNLRESQIPLVFLKIISKSHYRDSKINSVISEN